MKRKYLFLVFVAAWLLLGCKQEILEPEQMIQGRFALDDGSGLTSEYIDFNNGHLTVYTSTTYPLAEGKIWHTDGKTFKDTRASYSIQDGNLQTSAPSLSGPVELKDGILTIRNKKYTAMTGFEVNPYSKIIVERENTFPYTEQDISIPCSIERPIPAGQTTVSSNSAWITNPQVGDGVITGHLSGTNIDRTGSIIISYTHADAVTIQVSQAPSTFIRPASESLTLDYVASTPALDYTIENPVSTSVLTATASATWISDIQVSGTQVTFKVSENNTGANRSTTLLLKYAGARDVTVPVSQKWAASSISMIPSTQTVDYTGGSFTFSYSVTNPRANTSVTAASQDSWITDVKLVGTTVSYKVSENNSGAQRTGKIKLTYGSYATAEFTVTQAWTASTITMTPSTQTPNYAGGTFSFNYTVTNPRANTSVTATSQSNWITNVEISGNTVSYKVSENNSGAQRTGKIKLTYGSYATTEFTVTQTWTASAITMTPSTQTVDYTGGSFNFNYSVTNPRANTSVIAASQSNWITDVKLVGTNVSYKVSENNSSAQRTGKIKLTYGSYATTEFTVTQLGKPVVSLTLNKSELALLAGASETLIATVDPTDAQLQWTSGSTSVATVDQNGKVTAVGNGNTIITVSATDGSGKKATCAVAVTTLVSKVTLNKTSLILNEGGSETLTATISPSTASDKSLTWSSSNNAVARVDGNGKVTAVSVGTATITATANDGSGKSASCSVSVIPVGAVDLGLSVYWASCNIGEDGFVSSPEEGGACYSWGETSSKTEFTSATYKWYVNSSSGTQIIKYNNDSSAGVVDNKTVLETGTNGDDVASKILGDKWRMPTKAEMEELMNTNNCSWTVVTQDGRNGYLVTSKKNGNSIFLPSCGYIREGTELIAADTQAVYWTSSLQEELTDPWGAFALDIRTSSSSFKIETWGRFRGLSIRPVYDCSSSLSGNGIGDISYEEGGME